MLGGIILTPSLLAPVRPIANDASEETNEVIYSNDFSDADSLNDSVLQVAGDATLTWEEEIILSEEETASGIWVIDRENDWDGMDIVLSELDLQEEVEYIIRIDGFVPEGTALLEDSLFTLETVDGYQWLDQVSTEPGDFYTLEGRYSIPEEGIDDFIRIKTNNSAADVDFAILNIEITAEPLMDDEPEEPHVPVGEFALIDFEDGELNGFEPRGGNEVLEVSSEENVTEGGQYSLHVSEREQNWNGPSLNVTDFIHLGQEYAVSAWVKLDAEAGTTVRLSTQVGDGSSASYHTIASQQVSPEDEWVLLEGVYRYSSLGGGYVSIYIEADNESSNFYIDDIDFVLLESEPTEVQTDLTPLKEIYADDFLIGNAVSLGDMEGDRLTLLTHHHNLVTAENAMKPGEQYDDAREFDFSGPNRLVDRVREEELLLHGHVLVWHQQSPSWHHTAEDGSPLPEAEARENMERHIRQTMENYGDQVISWDVVNEALDGNWSDPEDWQSQLRNTGWLQALGPDYVYDAFLYARQVADENGWYDMILYYNDYNDHIQPKARTMYYMVRDINERYATEFPEDDRPLISGVGMQGHYNININPEHVRESLERFIELGVEIGITELDVTTITEGQYVEEEWIRQGYVYARLFKIFKEHADHISRVTFWGLNDSNSWRSERYPLLFDDRLQAKPAYDAVADPDAFLAEHDFGESEANHSYGVFGTPRLGEEEELWNEAPALPITRFQTAWQGATGVGRVLWDEDNLYIRVQVSDGDLDATAEAFHEQDSVEIFIEESGNKAFSYEEGVGQYRVNYLNEVSFNPNQYESGVVSYTEETGNGYIVEMAIPWKTVNPTEERLTIGFDLQINDASNGARQAVAAWNDLTGQGFQDPSVFGDLTLVGSMDEVDEGEEERIDEDETIDISPGETIRLGDGQASVTVPDDLPLGTQLSFRYLTEEDILSLGELVDEDGQALILAGEVVDVEITLPEGQEEYTGEFILELGIFNEFVEENVFVYYFNQEEQVWELRGGEVDADTIRLMVPGFSIYGVFALEEADEEENNEEEETDEASDTGTNQDSSEEENVEGNDDGIEDVESAGPSGERLPLTATNIWSLAAAGVGSVGLGILVKWFRKNKKK
jgi:endo-1,4-beta-xylanase